MKKVPLYAAVVGLSVLGLTSVTSTSIAQEVAKSDKQAQKAVSLRQSIFSLISSNIGPLGGMAKGQVPFDSEVAVKDAERMMQLAAMIPDYFVTDTSSFSIETEAKAKIWSNLDDFNQKAQNLHDAAQAVKTAASSEDKGAFRAAVGKLGGTCKGCHDEYRS